MAAAPAQADDLQQIRGIGPTFAKKLNDLGIYRYHQIAAWTAAERDWISADLGAQRIEKDEWIEQAAALAKPPVKAEDPPPA